MGLHDLCEETFISSVVLDATLRGFFGGRGALLTAWLELFTEEATQSCYVTETLKIKRNYLLEICAQPLLPVEC